MIKSVKQKKRFTIQNKTKKQRVFKNKISILAMAS